MRAELQESFRMARESLADHRLRASLTLLGVVAGVFAIVGVMTAMRGYQEYVEFELSQLGAQTFQISAKRPNQRGSAMQPKAPPPPITMDQFLTLAQRAKLPQRTAAEIWLVTSQASSRFARSTPDVGSVAL